MKRATVKDLANELGVSLSTINKALTGKPGVSEETRRQVQETAKRIGYRVNRIAQSLARNPITIGIIFPKVWPEFYGSLNLGMREVLKSLRDFNVIGKYEIVSNLYAKDEITQALNKFLELRVNAVVICPASTSGYGVYLEKLQENNIPVVILGTDLPEGNRLTSIRVDARLAGAMAAEFMGWLIPENKAAAVFIGNKDMSDHKEKVDGFCIAGEQCRSRIEGVYETQDEPEVAYHLTKKLISERPDLGGIYVATGNSQAVCQCIVEHGMEHQIKIIGTDIFPEIKTYVDNGVIQGVIFQDPIEQGRMAIRTIYTYLVEGTQCPPDILVNPQLVLKSNFEKYLQLNVTEE